MKVEWDAEKGEYTYDMDDSPVAKPLRIEKPVFDEIESHSVFPVENENDFPVADEKPGRWWNWGTFLNETIYAMITVVVLLVCASIGLLLALLFDYVGIPFAVAVLAACVLWGALRTIQRTTNSN